MGNTSWKGAHLADHQAQGGAASGLNINALAGEGDMVTVFDDFNSQLKGTEGFSEAAIFEDHGWVLTDVGTPVGDEIAMNDISNVDLWAPSCLYIYTGTADDAGGNMQIDFISGAIGTMVGTADFPHIFIPETDIGAAALDNTIFTFSCRIGLRLDITTTQAGVWGPTVAGGSGGKMFIGWAVVGEHAIMTPTTGVLAVAAAADQLLGFHVNELGAIDGISQRVGNTAYVEGTNFTRLIPLGGVSGTTANGAVTAGDTMWFDLALRMTVLDWSETTGNGHTEFAYRRVLPATGPPGADIPRVGPWNRHGTVLTDQCPNHTVALAPTIECINGPTAGVDSVFFVDWWSFGISRFSR
jgi:hypothetical protein